LKSFLPNFAIVNRAKDSDSKMAWELCAPIRAGGIAGYLWKKRVFPRFSVEKNTNAWYINS